MADILAAAHAVAQDVLFPRVMETDRMDAVPRENLDALAGAGLYGLAGPPEAGGAGADLETMAAVHETLAAACLATTFVWAQHHFAVRVLDQGAPQREEWLGPMCRGELRTGIALAGLMPGPPRLTATPDGDGWRLDGTAPWMTGWGFVDMMCVAARGPNDTVVLAMLDAVPQSGLTVVRQRLVAADAAVTVQLGFAGVPVGAGGVMGVIPYEEALYRGEYPLRMVGMIGLGVASRCCSLIGPSRLDDDLAAARKQLLTAPPEGLFEARAASAELVVRAAAALVVSAGSGAILAGSHPERLAREAAWALAFGSRPAIKEALLRRLGLS